MSQTYLADVGLVCLAEDGTALAHVELAVVALYALVEEEEERRVAANATIIVEILLSR